MCFTLTTFLVNVHDFDLKQCFKNWRILSDKQCWWNIYLRKKNWSGKYEIMRWIKHDRNKFIFKYSSCHHVDVKYSEIYSQNIKQTLHDEKDNNMMECLKYQRGYWKGRLYIIIYNHERLTQTSPIRREIKNVTVSNVVYSSDNLRGCTQCTSSAFLIASPLWKRNIDSPSNLFLEDIAAWRHPREFETLVQYHGVWCYK